MKAMDKTTNKNMQPKSFWSRPEGVTGGIFLAAILGGTAYLGYKFSAAILTWITGSTIGVVVSVIVLAALVYMALDPQMRAGVWYMYKSVMRWITSWFIKIDPISILKSYVEDLEENLTNMKRQLNKLRSQMHVLGELIYKNKEAIKDNLEVASKAKEQKDAAQLILKTRKAGRLKESNMRLEDLYRKMEVLYRVLKKMYDNSYVLKEDIADQVKMKEQERKAILASHSAMNSAMNIIRGDKDKLMAFDMALEAVADDVSSKVGEMERFMELSSTFMESIDLQNGVFEEEGLKMLEKWEKESSKLLGDEKEALLLSAEDGSDTLDLKGPVEEPVVREDRENQYDSFFD